jgi:hypothetical protein
MQHFKFKKKDTAPTVSFFLNQADDHPMHLYRAINDAITCQPLRPTYLCPARKL